MFHITDRDEAKSCRAKSPEACRYYRGKEDPRHYGTALEAAEASQALLQEAHGSTSTHHRYSFITSFKSLEEKFTHDFEGVPTRFFNADLRGKLVSQKTDIPALLQEVVRRREAGEASVPLGYFMPRELYARLAQSLSTPKDNQAPAPLILEAAEALGVQDLQEVPGTLVRSSRAWRGLLEGKQIIIGDGQVGEELASYRFRGTPEGFKRGESFMVVSARTLLGLKRMKRKVGLNPLPSLAQDYTSERRDAQRIAGLLALHSLEEAQEEGRNFLAQQKYVKDHRGAVATAWMDKKHPDALHRNLMDHHGLEESFRAVEIDNEVAPEEYHSFKEALEEVRDRLPSIPQERKPELRIRKLGKHKALGVFFPHKNTLCIDVRTSEAFIHELGHYYDFVVKENASLGEGFRVLRKRYGQALEVPGGGKNSEYYLTPTEVFARGFELYAHKRLGINNRLLNPESFKRFDYAPFTEDPKLEKELLDFMEGVFQK